jgi:hypothetical protein
MNDTSARRRRRRARVVPLDPNAGALAATRAGLSRSEAERTAWSGIHTTGGLHA